MKTFCRTLLASLALLSANYAVFAAPKQMENLSRGLLVSNVGQGVLVSWRLLGNEDPKTEFNLYRDGEKIATIGATAGTNYLDKSGKVSSKYTVSAVVGGKEGAKAGASVVLDKTVSNNNLSFPYKTLKLEVPAGQTMPDGTKCTYTPNDMSAADLDGDGEYELILKWDPSNAQDNSQFAYTGTVFIDAYKLDGTRMWRINLGKNIRAGAHYTQFQVFDYDGDGKAEMVVKTADGTVDGKGKVIGDASKDYRNSGGHVITGPEYLTVFRGEDGAAITTIDYEPSRTILQFVKGKNGKGYWGDDYGGRSERYIAATAYLDGVHPSVLMIRGYYTSSYVVAYDFDGTSLKQRWFHKSEDPGQGLYGQGNHNIATGDIDGDGYDEIVFGSAALNHDGTLRYTTKLGHGDAGHLSDLDPDLPGLEFFDVHEEVENLPVSDDVRDNEGNVLWGAPPATRDNGRGMAADIDSTHRGFEVWSARSGGLHDIKGTAMGAPSLSMNFRIYFDGDLQDELLDGAYVSKYHSASGKSDVYFDGPMALGATGCNGSKNTPSLVADLFGDWREELVVRSSTDPTTIYIVSTPVTSPYRVYTLMHDAVYRTAIAWQNTAYNQPPHLGYYLPDAVKKLTAPEIQVVGDPIVSVPDETEDYPVIKDGKSTMSAAEPVDGEGVFEATNVGFADSGYYNFNNAISSYGVWEIFSPSDVKTSLTIRFANGGKTNRNMALSVNGKSAGFVEFPAGSWTTYEDVTVDVALKAGKNVIKLSSTTSEGGPNVDQFTFAMDGIEIYNGQTVPEKQGIVFANRSLAGYAYNPQTGSLRSAESGSAEVIVYDMNGLVVGSVYKSVSVGLNSVIIDREMLPQGRYMVKVSVNGKVVSNNIFSLKK